MLWLLTLLLRFQFNYDGFFRQTTRDLEVLLASFDASK
jgi:hypothetical protein